MIENDQEQSAADLNGQIAPVPQQAEAAQRQQRQAGEADQRSQATLVTGKDQQSSSACHKRGNAAVVLRVKEGGVTQDDQQRDRKKFRPTDGAYFVGNQLSVNVSEGEEEGSGIGLIDDAMVAVIADAGLKGDH
ncbi:MAG: hypothetical protein AAFP90_10070 [Planctomycetota bacterium]